MNQHQMRVVALLLVFLLVLSIAATLLGQVV